MTLTWAGSFFPKFVNFRQNITLTAGLLGKIIGQINTFFCFVTIYSHVVVSLDRMMSIATPLRTGCFTSCRRTCVLVSVPWILAFFSVLHFFACNSSPDNSSSVSDDSCYRVYHPDHWFYSFADTECGRTMLTAHFVKDCIALTIMFVVDMVTLHYLRKRHTVSGWPGTIKASKGRDKQAGQSSFLPKSLLSC